MRRALLLLLLSPAALAAQFDFTVRAGLAAHGNHAHDPSASDHPGFAPSTSATVGASVGHAWGRTRLAIAFRHQAADLVLRGDDAAVVSPGVLRQLTLAATVGRRLAGGSATPALWVEFGVARSRWSFRGFDDPPHADWTALAALEATLALAGRWHGVLRLEGGLGGSMFAEAPIEGYATRTPTRGTVELGLRLVP
jgi:hypothetical protein